MIGCKKGPTTQAKDDRSPSKVVDQSAIASSQYVGSAACADCHAEIAADFAMHSMGRSASLLTADVHMESIENAKFEADGFRYRVEAKDGEWVHHQGRIGASGKETAPIDLVAKHLIGSGNHGQSFLVQRDDYLMMSPITWYPDKQIWALSPGFEKNNSQFNRPVVDSCLYCHTDVASPVEHTLNRYASPAISSHPIGCERCHGPGAEHVAHQNTQGTAESEDDSIVNPAKLDSDLREAICNQCHLSGAVRVAKVGKNLRDYRPGQPLESAFTVFSLSDGEDRFVGHVEQMHASRCFQSSEGQMGCISCHDPHRLPSPIEHVAYYRGKCLECHNEQSCANSIETRRAITKEDDCTQCHMPSIETEIQHAAITDHSIPRVPNRETATPDSNANPLIAFPSDVKAQATARDKAIALVRVVGRNTSLFSEQQIVQAQRDLEQAVGDDESDIESKEALAELYASERNYDRALETLQSVLAIEPRRERSLAMAGDICTSTQAFGQALGFWKSAVEVNPWMPKYWYRFAQSYAAAGDWNTAKQLAAEAKRRFPTSIGVRQILVQSHLELGNRAEADREFAELEEFNPPGFDSLKSWFEARVQRAAP